MTLVLCVCIIDFLNPSMMFLNQLKVRSFFDILDNSGRWDCFRLDHFDI